MSEHLSAGAVTQWQAVAMWLALATSAPLVLWYLLRRPKSRRSSREYRSTIGET